MQQKKAILSDPLCIPPPPLHRVTRFLEVERLGHARRTDWITADRFEQCNFRDKMRPLWPWIAAISAVMLRWSSCFVCGGRDFWLSFPRRRPARQMDVGVAAGQSVAPEFTYTNVLVKDTEPGISIHDITENVRACVKKHFANRRSHQRDGVVHLLSRHTTTAVSINEDETRLRQDIVAYLERLAPASDVYKHNDLHLRPASEKDRQAIDRNWMSQGKGTLEEFMAQEPKNAHSHLLAMTLGQSETIPVVGGELALGQWQSHTIRSTNFIAASTCATPKPSKNRSTTRIEVMEPMQALFTNLAIGAVVVPALLLLFHFGRDPRAILEKLSEMTGNEPPSSAGSPPAGKRKE
eukprot:s402_g35.t2